MVEILYCTCTSSGVFIHQLIIPYLKRPEWIRVSKSLLISWKVVGPKMVAQSHGLSN